MIKKIKKLKPKRLKQTNVKNVKREYKSFYKISLISLVIIFTFFVLPDTINFIKKNFVSNKIIVNASKQIFDEKLNQKNKKIKIDKDLISKNVFDDIDVFGKEESIFNPPRLSASTIEEVFNLNKYDLEKVKKTKLINVGNKITRLPKELKNVSSVKRRKELFIKIILPLIIEENARIRFDRKKLFVILNKSNNTKIDKEWLKMKFKQYGVKNNDLATLKIRMDEIPVSLAIAQSAKETGWGSSRFAQEGNALFGQWTWSGNGITPAAVDKNAKHKIARFKVLKASVKAYQRNLNTHPSYKDFRKERAIQRDNDKKLNSLDLVKYLDKYAETGVEYTIILKKIIKQNSLTEYDNVEILPTSLKMKERV
jgi:Bax protein